jgi:hypothetical protein
MDYLLAIFWIISTLFVVIGATYLSKSFGIIAMSTLYSAMVVISAVAATKIIDIFGLFVPAGVIIYAASFLITDLISEVYGKKIAIRTVWLGFFSMGIFSLYSYITVQWQAAPFWTNQEAYESVVGISIIRITIAGFVAFILSQLNDVTIFHLLKNRADEKGKDLLWVRNLVSTGTSQLIDTVVFITIAFYGVYDNILNLIIAQYTIKLIVAAVDTPLAYWGRKILKLSKHES